VCVCVCVLFTLAIDCHSLVISRYVYGQINMNLMEYAVEHSTFGIQLIAPFLRFPSCFHEILFLFMRYFFFFRK
jgi:hypothetical protein